MFPGTIAFKKLVEERFTGVPPEKLSAFFKLMDDELARLSSNYAEEIFRRDREQRISVKITGSDINGLALALNKTIQMPFSSIVSAYVDIENGVPTELGKRLLMSPELASEINSPGSFFISLFDKSLKGYGVTFENFAQLSYEIFNYAKCGIANGLVGGKALPYAAPLYWLPLGNSLFIYELQKFLEKNGGNVTVINLGAGPGAFEKMIGEMLPEYVRRINLICVETDDANMRSLIKILDDRKRLPNQRVIKKDFTDSEVQKEIERSMVPSSTVFVLAGYALQHVSPGKNRETLDWMQKIAKRSGGYVQVSEVSGGELGGGQSPVNRLFFNFMPAYHLLQFPCNSFYTDSGFRMLSPSEAEAAVQSSPSLFIPGTTPKNARLMLENGSIAVFSRWMRESPM